VKAAYLLAGTIHDGTMDDPVPAQGQALVRTHRCGMCASDQHILSGGENVVAMSRKFGGPYAALDLSCPFVLGHEYVGEVVDYGPGSKRRVKPGRRVTSVPIMRQQGAHGVIGFNNALPGGFGELMLLDEDFLLEVPDDIDDDHATLIEPLAVGLEHARRGNPKPGDLPLVVGCGAIGLGVIAGLRLLGISPIVASDLDPARRELALATGADLVIDPRETSPYSPLVMLGGKAPNLVYECVGRKGMLSEIVGAVGFETRIVLGGYCMEAEELFVFVGQNKRLNIQFAGGEEAQDMDLALRAIGDGRIDVSGWIGARIGRGGVGEAIAGMAQPGAPVRTVVDPRTA
jgi:threonine dehydrogenase-like Zn-dependent dehydrogenase